MTKEYKDVTNTIHHPQAGDWRELLPNLITLRQMTGTEYNIQQFFFLELFENETSPTLSYKERNVADSSYRC